MLNKLKDYIEDKGKNPEHVMQTFAYGQVLFKIEEYKPIQRRKNAIALFLFAGIFFCLGVAYDRSAREVVLTNKQQILDSAKVEHQENIAFLRLVKLTNKHRDSKNDTIID